jgi:hypothetical protein
MAMVFIDARAASARAAPPERLGALGDPGRLQPAAVRRTGPGGDPAGPGGSG